MYMSKVKIKSIGSKDCDVCAITKKELKKLKKAHPSWTIREEDIDKNPKKYDKINAIPLTLVCVGKKCHRITGGVTKEDIEEIVKS